MNKLSAAQLCVLGFCVALNFVGGLIALTLRLPIYLDSIGSILGAFLYGPVVGMVVGAASGLLNGIVFDPVSFYFIPSAITIGAMAGIAWNKGWVNNRRLPLGVFVMTLPGTIVSSCITALVFGGITSSGSSILVQLFSHLGIPMTASVFLVQIVTDYLDRSISAALALTVLTALPYGIRKRMA